MRDPHDAWWRQAFPLHLHTQLVLDPRARSAPAALDAARSGGARRSRPRWSGSSTGWAPRARWPRKQLDQLIAGALGGKPAGGRALGRRVRRAVARRARWPARRSTICRRCCPSCRTARSRRTGRTCASRWRTISQLGAPAALDKLRAVRDGDRGRGQRAHRRGRLAGEPRGARGGRRGAGRQARSRAARQAGLRAAPADRRAAARSRRGGGRARATSGWSIRRRRAACSSTARRRPRSPTPPTTRSSTTWRRTRSPATARTACS